VESAIEPSCGNVFEDLGFPRQEAVSLELRSFLAFRLEEFIETERLTQREAADFFGVSQPRISNLVRGRIELFSLDTLVDLLTRAGVRVEVLLRPGTGRQNGRVRRPGDPALRVPGRHL
jgi:predicted XRE-type DNA-binding protein